MTSLGPQIFWTIGSQVTVRLLALRADRCLSLRMLISIPVRGRVNLRATVLLEGVAKLKEMRCGDAGWIHLAQDKFQ